MNFHHHLPEWVWVDNVQNIEAGVMSAFLKLCNRSRECNRHHTRSFVINIHIQRHNLYTYPS